jgi:hypothetical protein
MPFDTTAIEALSQAVRNRLPPRGVSGAEVEGQLLAVLMALGAVVLGRILAELEPANGVVTEDGVTWNRVLQVERTYMSRFGLVTVERGLYRSQRNGPTRCFIEEKFGILDGFWTQDAARVALLLSTDLSSRAAERFLRESGGMAPSRSSLDRLPTRLSHTWEADRVRLEAELRSSVTIPAEATTVAVMLDGVMVDMVRSTRAALKHAARTAGRKVGGPVGDKEASVGALVFYGADGERLMTRRFGRMPEEDKATLKQMLATELAHVRKQRPDLIVVAVSDGAPNNWSFLESLNPDHQVVDFYHVVEHIKRRLDQALGVATLKNQETFAKMRRILLATPDGHLIVFESLERIERRENTWKERKTKGRGAQPNFYERHHQRMQYTLHRALHLPIGSGVIEGTCRYLVVDRLRRTGMHWSQAGGQAILTFRHHAANDQFNAAWVLLMEREAQNERNNWALAA